MAHPGGRPLKFQSVKELQEKIDAYFAECDPHWVDDITYEYPKDEKRKPMYDRPMVKRDIKKKTAQIPYTITGLALALGTTRDVLIDYEDKEEFSNTIKDAKAKCHMFAEMSLFGPSATGPIFNLKNNYGWQDRTEQDITSGGERITPTVRIIDERPRNTDTK